MAILGQRGLNPWVEVEADREGMHGGTGKRILAAEVLAVRCEVESPFVCNRHWRKITVVAHRQDAASILVLAVT